MKSTAYSERERAMLRAMAERTLADASSSSEDVAAATARLTASTPAELVAEIKKVPGGIRRVREALREPPPPVGVLDPVTGSVRFSAYVRHADGSIVVG